MSGWIAERFRQASIQMTASTLDDLYAWKDDELNNRFLSFLNLLSSLGSSAEIVG